MNTLLKFVPIGALCAVAFIGLAVAADLPKEGTYDFTACYSGVSNPIAFSKTHSARSYEHWGALFSNPPGGIFDKGSFHCVGLSTSFDGKDTVTTFCEIVFLDGDKALLKYSLAAGASLGAGASFVEEAMAGTGKYEGMAFSGTFQSLRPFPVITAGRYQDCGHQTGTYKLK